MTRNQLSTSESIIVDAQSYYEQLIEAIDLAQQEVLLESYIFNNDFIGLYLNSIISILLEALG